MPPSVCSRHWASFRNSKYSNCSSSWIGADVQVATPSLDLFYKSCIMIFYYLYPIIYAMLWCANINLHFYNGDNTDYQSMRSYVCIVYLTLFPSSNNPQYSADVPSSKWYFTWYARFIKLRFHTAVPRDTLAPFRSSIIAYADTILLWLKTVALRMITFIGER
jgi:hypothetical protein